MLIETQDLFRLRQHLMRKVIRLTVPASFLMILTVCFSDVSADLDSLWEFEDGGDLGHATIGIDMTFNTNGGPITFVPGVSADDNAANVPIDSFLEVAQAIGPNGVAAQAKRTNVYTLLIDFKAVGTLPAFSALFDCDNGNTDDADYFIRKQTGSNELGISSNGYVGAEGTVVGDTWYRLVLSVDHTNQRSTYLDGILVGDHTAGFVDQPRWSLGPLFTLFSDNGGFEETIIEVSNVALFDTALDASEIGALGTAGSPISTISLVGLWEFEDSDDLEHATIGNDLTFILNGGPITFVPGVGGSDNAATVPIDSFIEVSHDIAANGGGSPGSRTNIYSLLIDFQAVGALPPFSALFDCDNGNTVDADYFIRKQAGSNELGIGANGYVGAEGTVFGDTWYRLVLSVDQGVVRSTYLNGVFLGDHTAGFLDQSRWSLSPSFTLFSDNGGLEETVIQVSNVALFDTALDADAIAKLGVAGDPIPIDILLGDVNCDGDVNLLDVEPFVEVLVSGVFNAKADINQDGVVDLLDVEPFVDILTGGP